VSITEACVTHRSTNRYRASVATMTVASVRTAQMVAKVGPNWAQRFRRCGDDLEGKKTYVRGVDSKRVPSSPVDGANSLGGGSLECSSIADSFDISLCDSNIFFF
jgi:hypothetical protein